MAHDWYEDIIDGGVLVICRVCHVEWNQHLRMIHDVSLTECDCQSIIESHPK